MPCTAGSRPVNSDATDEVHDHPDDLHDRANIETLGYRETLIDTLPTVQESVEDGQAHERQIDRRRDYRDGSEARVGGQHHRRGHVKDERRHHVGEPRKQPHLY